MLSFLRTNIPRADRSSQNPIHYEDGASSLTFHSPSSDFLMTHKLPPSNIRPTDKQRTFIAPPPHYHRNQTEDFLIRSGTGRFILRGVPHLVTAGNSIHIPRWAPHTFENGSDDELLVEIRLNPSNKAVEERFFRNAFGYLDDCRRAGKEPSLPQLLLFFYGADIPLALPLPGPEGLVGAVSWVFTVIVGLIVGEWLMGYQLSYPEYYEGSDRKTK